MQGSRILLAISTPELYGLVLSILDKHHLCIVKSVEEAVESFHPDLDLIISGLHFDAGRMYELLKSAKASPAVKDIPFVTVQLTGGILPYGVYKSMDSAFHLLGGELFLQVDKWRIELGDEQAYAKLRDVVETMTATRH